MNYIQEFNVGIWTKRPIRGKGTYDNRIRLDSSGLAVGETWVSDGAGGFIPGATGGGGAAAWGMITGTLSGQTDLQAELDLKANLAGATFTGPIILATGTTTLAPIKFIAGINLTTPVAGVIEFDGTNFYITI